MVRKQNPKISVSIKLKNRLDKMGSKTDSYEDIIWRLIKIADKLKKKFK